ncbi:MULTISPECIES: sensor histidine kinase [Pelosinus]|uniref:histidine kinase n=1 Tax=Pelosinus fermentans B4 TaxID=1149862 RepID=I9B4Z7_9FIRM|nr:MULTISPECIES: HAMP domain-containing sensor histidine kinase [Pelosinus]EIW20222.1 ATP-binding region ATPase domain protein [Pelosinus fermentans B4]EIW25940.1 integral membrane sensor signal transduction histidine kinase [Pelosinus fermentans A11]OAM93238.1 integral membrane sensor signal transduction histidine kinase [Pelosinus fermentans DSM 17108]SDQ71299.1 Signal transduction histidine kinase [Pelosinus fermentans]
MFQKTLRRLTLVNSIVFLVIFIIFGGTLYGYVARQIFDDIDESMERRVNAFRIPNIRLRDGGPPLIFFESRILILLRDIEGKIINLHTYPIEGLPPEVLDFLETASTEKWQTPKIDHHVYRILSNPYPYTDETIVFKDRPIKVKDVIAISIVDSELAMLRRFLIIIFIGQLIGMTAIVLGSYYLARRALVPIQAAWEKQQQFVADASHELRTPLAVIKSNAELLLRSPEHTIELETIRITNVIRETIRMSKLVSTLFTLARADANQMEIEAVPILLNEIIDRVVEQFVPLAQMQGVSLDVKCSDTIWLSADRERLHQLFVILLDNAIKYTPQEGNIQIICCKHSSKVLIQVKDTGCGILPADLPYIFERFFRGDKVRSRKNGGAGLGLAIAQWIVEKHEGKIWVESQAGIGTQVYVTLPIETS